MSPTLTVDLTLDDEDMERLKTVCGAVGKDLDVVVSTILTDELKKLQRMGSIIIPICQAGRPLRYSQCDFCKRNAKAAPRPRQKQTFVGFCNRFKELKARK